MTFNRGLVPPATDPHERPRRELVLVQARDVEGFWNNVMEPSSVKSAIYLAQEWAVEHKVDTRVCRGPKRELVREFFA